jgi:phosphoglycerol transferase MdoB-like AlkP superfamily enzyme
VTVPPSTAASQARALSRVAGRWIAAGLAFGTLLYVVPSVLHGNPPVESAELTLRYVAGRPAWRPVHLVNIAAVLVWAVTLTALGARLTGAARQVAQAGAVVLTAAAGVFAVYFSIHAMALPTAASRFIAGEQEQVLAVTEAVMLVLGAIAFTAQAALGLSMLLYGLAIAVSRELPAAVGWLGVFGGAGWLTGAVLIDFAVIVPFTVICWVWTLVLAVVLLRAGREGA